MSSFSKFLCLVVALGCSVFACGSKQGAEPPPVPQPTVDSDPASRSASADQGDWEQYWPLFKQAALAGDKAAVLALTQVNDELDQETAENELFTLYLSKDVLEVIADSDAAAIPVTEGTAGAADEVRELRWSEAAMVDGHMMGSSLFLYFKKFDGKYRLFRVAAAG